MSRRSSLILQFFLPWIFLVIGGWCLFSMMYSSYPLMATAGLFFTKAFSILNACLFIWILILSEKKTIHSSTSIGLTFLLLGVKFLLSLGIMIYFFWKMKDATGAQVLTAFILYFLYTLHLLKLARG